FTERGLVHVRAKLVGDGGICFSVRDTGIGIAGENKDVVWQEWGQIESAQRPKYKGSGLGLPLARQLATLLGGTTWLRSELGKGSTFYVEIPTAVTSTTPPMRASETLQTILIV